MIVLRVDAVEPEPELIARAAAELARGGLVAFPTETVYGLGALASDERAIRRVFETKGRPPTHPLIAHVLDADAARALSSDWTATARALAEAFWPGPLTIVVEKARHVSPLVTGGGSSIAIRAPSHPVARALLSAAGSAIVAPSANRYQTLSPTRAEHVVSSLAGADLMVLDGGACPGGIESTVVDARGDHAIVLRLGGVEPAALRRVVGSFTVATAASGSERASPGMDERHYAPRARLVIAPTRQEAIATARATRGAALVVFGSCDEPGAISLSDDAERAARDLYATLHAIDASGAAQIVVEAPPNEPGWEAIADRLTRASR